MDFGVARSTEAPIAVAEGQISSDTLATLAAHGTARPRRADGERHGGRHHRVHGARAVARRGRGSARRHLCVRADPVRPAARPDPRRTRQERDRGTPEPHARGAAAAPRNRSRDSGGRRAHRHEVRAAGSRRPVRDVTRPRARTREARRARRAAAARQAHHLEAGDGSRSAIVVLLGRDVLVGARPGRGREARARLDPDHRPQERDRRADVRRRARADAEARARGRGVHQRLRPQRHPAQPRRRATRGPGREGRPRPRRPAGRRRRARRDAGPRRQRATRSR